MNGVITKILTMSVTAGVVILLVLVVRLALRKMPKVFSYALWAVVLFRLLCPVSFSSNMSLFGLFDTPTAATEYVEPASHVGGTVTGSVRNENGARGGERRGAGDRGKSEAGERDNARRGADICMACGSNGHGGLQPHEIRPA